MEIEQNVIFRDGRDTTTLPEPLDADSVSCWHCREGTRCHTFLHKTSRSIVLCLILAVTGCSSSILTVLSRGDGDTYSYNSATVPFVSELLKLTVCSVIALVQYRKDPTSISSVRETWGKYAVIGLLYAIQNNLAFVALLYIDPGTMEVLGQVKIPLTAFMFARVFAKTYEKIQIAGLALITGGAMLSRAELVECFWSGEDDESVCKSAAIGISVLAIMCCISTFAGIANEYLLKSERNGSLFWQNVQLYAATLFFDLISALVRIDRKEKTLHSFFEGYTWMTWALIVNLAVVGISVSITLKYADNVVHAIATALAMVLSMIFTVLMTAYVLNVHAVVGILFVLLGVLLYFQAFGGPRQESI